MTMSRPEESGTEADQADQADRRAEEEDAERSEPVTPPIDEDVAGSVNAALHEADE
jgi:hypothetical protein